MSSNPIIMSFVGHIVDGITAASDALFELCNGLAGRSWLLDNVIALAMNNQLIKAAVIGGCFFAVWHGSRDEDNVRRHRRILLVTLLASALVIAMTQSLSKSVLLPRPYVHSLATFHLHNGGLVENPRVSYRVPLDNESQRTYQALLKGEIAHSDLGSFPSDHAGLFVTFAAGILLASRPLGWLAMGWTLLVVLESRVIAGHHSPLDIVAGAGIGIVTLWLLQYIFARSLRPLVESVVSWTLRHETLATVLLFIAVFEVSNALQDLRPLFEIGASIAERPFF